MFLQENHLHVYIELKPSKKFDSTNPRFFNLKHAHSVTQGLICHYQSCLRDEFFSLIPSTEHIPPIYGDCSLRELLLEYNATVFTNKRFHSNEGSCLPCKDSQDCDSIPKDGALILESRSEVSTQAQEDLSHGLNDPSQCLSTDKDMKEQLTKEIHELQERAAEASTNLHAYQKEAKDKVDGCDLQVKRSEALLAETQEKLKISQNEVQKAKEELKAIQKHLPPKKADHPLSGSVDRKLQIGSRRMLEPSTACLKPYQGKLDCLKRNELITSTVIDEAIPYLKRTLSPDQLLASEKNVYIAPTYFIDFLKARVAQNDRRKLTFFLQNRLEFVKSRILIPVNSMQGEHWSILLVLIERSPSYDHHQCRFQVLDSYYGKRDPLDKEIELVWNFLIFEVEPLLRADDHPVHYQKINPSMEARFLRVHSQNNLFDCGAFCLEYILEALRTANGDHKNFCNSISAVKGGDKRRFRSFMLDLMLMRNP